MSRGYRVPRWPRRRLARSALAERTVEPGRLLIRRRRDRLRAAAWPVLQTAIGAVAAWAIAVALLPEKTPIFASIAVVIALGGTFGQRGRRTVELVAGVVLGIGAAELIVSAIGTGAPQIGLLVVLAMTGAVLLGGGQLLVSEAAIAAILLASLEPSGDAPPATPLRSASSRP